MVELVRLCHVCRHFLWKGKWYAASKNKDKWITEETELHNTPHDKGNLIFLSKNLHYNQYFKKLYTLQFCTRDYTKQEQATTQTSQ